MPPAKKLTESFKRLQKNLSRGETLLAEFFDKPGGKARGVGQPKAHEQELLRAVLVLTVGALDAFLSELLIELLPRIANASPDAAVFDASQRRLLGLFSGRFTSAASSGTPRWRRRSKRISRRR